MLCVCACFKLVFGGCACTGRIEVQQLGIHPGEFCHHVLSSPPPCQYVPACPISKLISSYLSLSIIPYFSAVLYPLSPLLSQPFRVGKMAMLLGGLDRTWHWGWGGCTGRAIHPKNALFIYCFCCSFVLLFLSYHRKL